MNKPNTTNPPPHEKVYYTTKTEDFHTKSMHGEIPTEPFLERIIPWKDAHILILQEIFPDDHAYTWYSFRILFLDHVYLYRSLRYANADRCEQKARQLFNDILDSNVETHPLPEGDLS